MLSIIWFKIASQLNKLIKFIHRQKLDKQSILNGAQDVTKILTVNQSIKNNKTKFKARKMWIKHGMFLLEKWHEEGIRKT